MRNSPATIVFAAAILAAPFCAGGLAFAGDKPGTAGHAQTEDRAADTPHWDYAHEDKWSETFADAYSCARGARQSPIDLKSAPLVDEPDLKTAYKAGLGRIYNNGHTIEIGAEPGSFMTLDDERFELLQAHFHHPSEHAIDGKRFAMEMHFVHRKEAGALAVVGVMLREGVKNPQIAKLWSAVPKKIGKAHEATVAFDPNAFLPEDRVHFQYDGSLTTPPCTEGVTWLVLRESIEASQKQVAAFRAIEGENARSLQARNGRMITEGE